MGGLITELPTELILEITSYFGFEDTSQVHFALTCRRFYEIFLPQILEDQIEHADKLVASSRVYLIQDLPTNGQVIGRITDPIMEPFRGSFRRISFRVGGIEKDVRCVQGLIARAKHLQEVDLQLGEACSLREVAAVINTCAGRPELCLTVSGTMPSNERGPFKFEFQSSGKPIPLESLSSPPPITEKAKRYLRSFLGVFSPFFKAPQSQVLPKAREHTSKPSSPTSHEITVLATLRNPKFRISELPRPQLTSFSISSETLFMPSLYPVTINVLNNSPVQTLLLSNLTLSIFDWSNILPSITLPALRSLTIGNLSLGFPDFLAFLERHASITAIDLTGNDVIGVVKLPSKPILPLLNSLTANYEYLVPFLQHKKLGHFPVLQQLGIQSPRGISSPSMALYPYPRHQLHPIYDLISQGQFTDLSISLDTLSTSGLIDWLLHIPGDKETRHQLSGVHSLVVANHDLFVAPNLIQEWVLRHASLIGEDPAGYYSRFSEGPIQVIETLIWSASPELEALKLGPRGQSTAPPFLR